MPLQRDGRRRDVRSEQHAGQRAEVRARRRAVPERLEAHVVGAGVEVRARRLGDRLRVAVRDDRVDQPVAPPPARSRSVNPKRSRLLV